jgi:hypothetical protein
MKGGHVFVVVGLTNEARRPQQGGEPRSQGKARMIGVTDGGKTLRCKQDEACALG